MENSRDLLVSYIVYYRKAYCLKEDNIKTQYRAESFQHGSVRDIGRISCNSYL